MPHQRRSPKRRARKPDAYSLSHRASGILAHITSLPGPYGSGDIGSALFFVDFLSGAGQRWWQMLPVGPIGDGNSPYSARSAMAGEPLLIDPADLARQNLLTKRDLDSARALREDCVEYTLVRQTREQLLRKSFVAFERRQRKQKSREYVQFCRSARSWLDDYALYMALRSAYGDIPWTRWPAEIRDRDPEALRHMERVVGREMRYRRFLQFQFHRQWTQLLKYARQKKIGLIGDVPFYVELDSADVWANRDIFKLNAKGMPTHRAGVPPDYFSNSGQLWGNPLYSWKALKNRDYDWWLARIGHALIRFDALRLDHFIGFHRAWSVPARLTTAKSGKYESGPGAHIFERMKSEFGRLPFIAEDLGVVTPEVTALREQFALPGVRVVQFGLSDESGCSEHLPHNYPERCIAYTGTHDNDTAVGWFNDAGRGATTRSRQTIRRERELALRYLGGTDTTIHWSMIRMAMASQAQLTVIPLQDVLGLGSEARMNRPARSRGNWEWRVDSTQLTATLQNDLAALTRVYGRIPPKT